MLLSLTCYEPPSLAPKVTGHKIGNYFQDIFYSWKSQSLDKPGFVLRN